MKVTIPEKLLTIMKHLSTKDGVKPYLAGGCVRDALSGEIPHDFDVEVYGISYDDLHKELKVFGSTDVVGKAFGVIKLTDNEGNSYDFSLPRIDSKVSDASTGKGRGFEVKVDHNLTPEEACSRRDFTINAMLYDPQTDEIIDPFNGQKDLQDKILRATSDKFSEDPLRALRGFQFVSRFGLHTTSGTYEMLKGIKDTPLVPERVGEEWMKFFKKGKYLADGLEYLRISGWLMNYPEIYNLMDVQQSAAYHPEGDVFTHTAIVLQRTLALIEQDSTITETERVVLLLAALCHDFGKVSTTIQNERCEWTSPGHAQVGAQLAYEFMARIKLPLKEFYQTQVHNLVLHHMDFVNWKTGDKVKIVRTLADQLYPAYICDLHILLKADRMISSEDDKIIDGVMRCAKAQGVYDKHITPIVTGMDILTKYPQAHIDKDKRLGLALSKAHEVYLSGKIHTKEEALIVAMNQLRKTNCCIQGSHVMIQCGIPEGEKIGYYLNLIWEMQLQGAVATEESAIHLIKNCELMMQDARLELVADCTGLSLKKYKFRKWISSVLPAIVLMLFFTIVGEALLIAFLWGYQVDLKHELGKIDAENYNKWHQFETMMASPTTEGDIQK